MKLKEKQRKENEKFRIQVAEGKKVSEMEWLTKKKIKQELKSFLIGQKNEGNEKAAREKQKKILENEIMEKKSLSIEKEVEEEKMSESIKQKQLKAEIESYLKFENQLIIKRREDERQEMKLQNIRKKVAYFLEDKIKVKSIPADSENKKQNLILFVQISNDIGKKGLELEDKIECEIIEKNKKDLSNILKFQEKRKKLNEMLKEDMKDAARDLSNVKFQKKKDKEMEIAEREKRERFDKWWEKEEKKRKLKSQMKVRNDYIKQIQEKERKENEEKAFEKSFVLSLNEENKVLTKYCDYIVELTKKEQRPLFPVLNSVKVSHHFNLYILEKFFFSYSLIL